MSSQRERVRAVARWTRRLDEKAQALPLVILALLVLLGVIALIIDGGMAYAQRRYMQNAADAAALAGASLISKGGATDAQLVSTATSYAQANKATTVSIDYVDSTGNVLAHAGQGSIPGSTAGLKVVASVQYSTSFARVLGIATMHISATAKAGLKPAPGTATIMALSTTACSGLSVSGTADITATGTVTFSGGGIQVNATCPTALSLGGTSHISAVGGQIKVSGGYSHNGNSSANPPPITGAPYMPDPLADVAAPNISSYPVRHGTANSPSTLTVSPNQSVTLDPGIYYGGISSKGNVTMRPGVYIIAGGEFTQAAQGNLIADGVFIYVTRASPSDAFASVSIGAGSASRIRPPTSGPYKNLSIFQDRANTRAASISGGGDLLGGTFYFPSASLSLGGNGALNGTAQLICDTISASGTGDMTFTYDGNSFFGLPMAAIID
jgi:Flp pilus assembly protein TadG